MSLLVFVVVAVGVRRPRARSCAGAPARRRTAVGLVGLRRGGRRGARHRPGPGRGRSAAAASRRPPTCGCSSSSARSSGWAWRSSGLAGGSRRDAPAVTLGHPRRRRPDPRPRRSAGGRPRRDGRRPVRRARDARARRTAGPARPSASARRGRSIVAGALAIAATAWFGRDLSELAAQPVVFGLAYLAFAVAVAMRFGAIPFHLWAARLTDVVPETALPILTALAPGVARGRRPRLDRRVGRAAAASTSTSARLDRPRASRSRRSSWPRSRRSSRTTSSTSSATRSSATPGSSCSRWRRSTRRPGRRPGPGSSSSSSRAARSRPGSAGIRAGLLDRPDRRPARLGLALAAPRRRLRAGRRRQRSGSRGCVAFDARTAARRPGPRRARSRPSSCSATLAPLAYYGRLLVDRPGAARPGRRTGATPGGRGVTRPDLTGDPALARRTTWDANRAFTHRRRSRSCSAVLALATSAGAFGGPAAAAGLPPSLDRAGRASSRRSPSGEPAGRRSSRSSRTPSRTAPAHSFGASTQRSTSRS